MTTKDTIIAIIERRIEKERMSEFYGIGEDIRTEAWFRVVALEDLLAEIKTLEEDK